MAELSTIDKLNRVKSEDIIDQIKLQNAELNYQMMLLNIIGKQKDTYINMLEQQIENYKKLGGKK